MTPERWQQVKLIATEALERDPTARAAFVTQACAGDVTLESEINLLLAQDAQSIDDCAADARTEMQTEHDSRRIGERLGAYQVLREIGRGGMGTVYLAQRVDGAFEKQVAIKVLKRGLDTDEVLRRFLAERQILARLDHPGIVRVIDAGTTDDGLPYLAMDYVEAAPITQFARERQLSVRERLKVFREVCSAVTYAHQNLIVHRDLKPSNILITREGQVRLLDFGIAKLLEPDAEGYTVTVTMLRIMTPEYASPEQVKGEAVTTVSDVYSLGVVLYELLTGERPFHLKRGSADEITKAICEREPERPSTAVTANLEQGDGTEEVRRQLRGDLDNIILKALQKQPQRRYSSVDHLSDDIRRHLEGLPVRARKDTHSYRASKFIQRNKLGVAAATLVLLTLVGGIIGTTWEARRANRRFAEGRRLAHSVLFDYHDAIATLPGSTAVRERLIKDVREYLDNLSREAGNDRPLQREIASAYLKLGDVQGYSRRANIGDTKDLPADRKSSYWHQAKESFQKSLYIWQDMKAKGILTGTEAGKPDELAKAVANCEAKLAISK